MEERNKTREIEEIPSNELEGYPSQFVFAARTKERKEHKPLSLRGILSSSERHLSTAGYGKCIFKDNELKTTRDALKDKQKELKRHGYGYRQRSTTALTDEEINTLFDKQLLASFGLTI